MSTRQASLAIRGMYCPTCAVNLERALGQLDGVITAQVNFATERASVVYNPTRVVPQNIVDSIRNLSFDTPLDRRAIYSNDLLYATSPRTVQNAVRNAEGVVSAAVHLAERRVDVELIPGNRNHIAVLRSLAGLGFRVLDRDTPNASFLFAMRTLIITGIWALILWSATSHVGWLAAPGLLHIPLTITVLAPFVLLGVALPYFQSAFDALLQGKYDSSVLIAVSASTVAVATLPLGFVAQSAAVADLGLVIATTLTAGWFLARAASLWVWPRLQRQASAILGGTSTRRMQLSIPVIAGSVAAAAVLGIYLGALSLLQSPSHAWEQLVADGVWAALVATGFGAQIGLYAFLRLIVQAAKATGATAVTGAGTGTSTLGMLACCAHHLGDVAPLVALTGVSGLSGAVGFLTEWKYALIGLGVAMNVVGIIVSVRIIRRCLVHQAEMANAAAEGQTALACH